MTTDVDAVNVAYTYHAEPAPASTRGARALSALRLSNVGHAPLVVTSVSLADATTTVGGVDVTWVAATALSQPFTVSVRDLFSFHRFGLSVYRFIVVLFHLFSLLSFVLSTLYYRALCTLHSFLLLPRTI
jgi:hypothetical protein